MNHIQLTEDLASTIKEKLKETGYVMYERSMCERYYKSSGDSVFIHHSLNIIRSSKNTEGQEIVTKTLGTPNGTASEKQDDHYDSWFCNGYGGKAGTKLV